MEVVGSLLSRDGEEKQNIQKMSALGTGLGYPARSLELDWISYPVVLPALSF